MRVLIACAALALSACAKGHDLQCTRLNAAPVQVVYPDGTDHKSDVTKCDDGTFEVINMAGDVEFTTNYPPMIKETP